MNRFIILTFSLLVFAACAPTNSSHAGHESRFGLFKVKGSNTDKDVAQSSSGYDPLKAHLLARAAVDPTGRKQNPYAYNYQDKSHAPVSAPQGVQLASVSDESGVTVGLNGVPFPVRKPVINGQFANAQTVEPVASIVSSSVQGFGSNMEVVPVPPHKPFVTASADHAAMDRARPSSTIAILPSRKPAPAGQTSDVEERPDAPSVNMGGIPVPAHKPVL